MANPGGHVFAVAVLGKRRREAGEIWLEGQLFFPDIARSPSKVAPRRKVPFSRNYYTRSSLWLPLTFMGTPG